MDGVLDLDQMTAAEQAEFAELLFEDLLQLFHDAKQQEVDTLEKMGYI